MNLSSEEKRALRHKQKLLFSSGQFPLTGGAAGRKRALKKRRSPLKALGLGFAAFLILVIALVVLVTKAARADEGEPANAAAAKTAPAKTAPAKTEATATEPTKTEPRRIDVELEVRGERPGPSVVFIDGGRELLRRRMRALALEAGRDNASLGVAQNKPKGPPAEVRVLGVSVTDGLVLAPSVRRALTRAQESLGACWTGTGRKGLVRAEVTLGAAGVPERVRVLVDKTGAERGARVCAQQALSAARWPTPAPDDAGTARATVRVDLLVAPARSTSR